MLSELLFYHTTSPHWQIIKLFYSYTTLIEGIWMYSEMLKNVDSQFWFWFWLQKMEDYFTCNFANAFVDISRKGQKRVIFSCLIWHFSLYFRCLNFKMILDTTLVLLISMSQLSQHVAQLGLSQLTKKPAHGIWAKWAKSIFMTSVFFTRFVLYRLLRHMPCQHTRVIAC